MEANFKAEIESDLKKIKRMLKLCKRKTLVIGLIAGGQMIYWMEKNSNAICMLKKERKTLKKKLQLIN